MITARKQASGWTFVRDDGVKLFCSFPQVRVIEALAGGPLPGGPATHVGKTVATGAASRLSDHGVVTRTDTQRLWTLTRHGRLLAAALAKTAA